VNSIRIV